MFFHYLAIGYCFHFACFISLPAVESLIRPYAVYFRVRSAPPLKIMKNLYSKLPSSVEEGSGVVCHK